MPSWGGDAQHAAPRPARCLGGSRGLRHGACGLAPVRRRAAGRRTTLRHRLRPHRSTRPDLVRVRRLWTPSPPASAETSVMRGRTEWQCHGLIPVPAGIREGPIPRTTRPPPVRPPVRQRPAVLAAERIKQVHETMRETTYGAVSTTTRPEPGTPARRGAGRVPRAFCSLRDRPGAQDRYPAPPPFDLCPARSIVSGPIGIRPARYGRLSELLGRVLMLHASRREDRKRVPQYSSP